MVLKIYAMLYPFLFMRVSLTINTNNFGFCFQHYMKLHVSNMTLRCHTPVSLLQSLFKIKFTLIQTLADV
jgi:hypothetical protein